MPCDLHEMLASGFLPQREICQHECGHGFYDGYRSWNDTGIVTPLGFKYNIVAIKIGGLLWNSDRSRWFEGNMKEYGFSIGDPALNASAVVRKSP